MFKKKSKCRVDHFNPINPNQTGVSESLKKAGAKGPTGENQLYWPYFWHSKHQNLYQGTLGTQELPPTGYMTSHGPSLGPTGSLKKRPCDFQT